MAGIVNAANRVPEHQRYYQAAYKAHTRVWRIHPRSGFLTTPFVVVMWGTFGSCMWCMGRKVLGYNTWFGKE